MKDKLIQLKDTIMKRPILVASVGFALVSLVLILVAIFALNEFVVSVCVLIILEALMAALLHKAELWKHGILVLAQFIVGIVLERIPLVILMIIAYVVATLALQLMSKSKENSPKA